MNQNTMQDLMILYFEKIMDDFERLILALNETDFSIERKEFLARVYVNNRISRNNKNSELGDLICSSAITSNFSFDEQKKVLGYYLYDNSIYNIVAIKYNEKKTPKEIIEEIEKSIKKKLSDREMDCSNSLYVLTSNLDIYNYRTSKDLEKIMYYCNDDLKNILPDIVTNDEILKNRSTEEQLEFMRIYLNNPTVNLKNLIINTNNLKNMDGKEHIRIINEYLIDTKEEEKNENNVIK